MVLNLDEFKLDCKTCNDNQKIERGCVEDSPILDKWEIGGYKYQRCPLKIINADSNWLIMAYNFKEKGLLPRQGGWLDQSNKFIESMSFIMRELQDGKEQTTN